MKKAAANAAHWQGAASSKGLERAQCRSFCPVAGLDLKTLFTIGRRRRYGAAMLILAAAALVASPPAPERVAPDRQARATVRIISAAKLHFAELERSDPQLFREAIVRSANGSAEAAKLIEFQ